MHFNVFIRIQGDEEEMDVQPEQPKRLFDLSTMQSSDSLFNKYPHKKAAGMKRILDFSIECGKFGLPLNELIVIDLFHSQENVARESSDSHAFLQECASILLDPSLGLLCFVGFDEIRVVNHLYLKDWTVPVSERTDGKPLFCLPRLWIDINGTIQQAIFEGCIESMLFCVMYNPGVAVVNMKYSLKGSIAKKIGIDVEYGRV